MNYKVTIQYLLISVLLIGVSFLLAYNFWWKLDLYSGEFFLLFFILGLCWFGTLHIGILVSRKINFKNDNFGFIGLLNLNKLTSQENFLKFRKTLTIFSFAILILTIFIFYKIVNFVEYTDLTYYGIEKSVKIEDISYYKGNKRAKINFEFNNEKISKKLFLKDTLKNVGEFETIIFSSRNPNIVELKSEFEENSK